MGVLGLFGAGTASAVPDVDGMTYEDAVAAIEEDGGIPKISVTVGSRQDAMGACLVTRAVDGSFYRPIPDDVYFGNDEGDVLLTLNCNRGAATATTPGPSAASPAGPRLHSQGRGGRRSRAERGSRTRGGRRASRRARPGGRVVSSSTPC